MDKEKIRVYFLGSGRVGARSLQALEKAEEVELVGIGTQPDRQAGRNKKPVPTPFARELEKEGRVVERIEDVNKQRIVEDISGRRPDMILVASFGQLLKKQILTCPCFGCVNIHASVLPSYRGASPIQAAIRNGDAETGVSFMEMEETLDTGSVYRTARCPIAEDETTESLEEKLNALAAGYVANCVQEIYEGNVEPVPQQDHLATFAPKLEKKDAEVDWTTDAKQLERDIRAFYPWPMSWFEFCGRKKRQRIQILELSVVTERERQGDPGTVIQADKNGWVIACGKGSVRLDRIIPAGRKPMSGSEFVRGAQLQRGGSVVSAW